MGFKLHGTSDLNSQPCWQKYLVNVTLRQYSNQMIKIFLAFKMKSTSFSTSTHAKTENLVKGQQKITQCFRKRTSGAPVPYVLQKPCPMAWRYKNRLTQAPPRTSAAQQFWRISLHYSCLRNLIPSSISLTWARKAPQEYHLKSNWTTPGIKDIQASHVTKAPDSDPTFLGKYRFPPIRS